MDAQSLHTSRELLDLPGAYEAPTSETEKTIASIWRAVFEIDDIGIDDDFFDLGGDSVKATRITEEINLSLGNAFKAGQLVEHPTIREVAAAIDGEGVEDGAVKLPSHILTVRKGGIHTPLFIVHGLAGFFFPNAEYMGAFRDDQPIYAFQVPGFDGQMEPLGTVEEIAEEYVKAVLAVDPDGPWHLAGMCSGCWITFEMARRLKERGKEPGRVILIDPYIERGRMREQFETNRRVGASGPIALAASALSRTRLAYTRLKSKIGNYRATGLWISSTDPKAFDIPEVRQKILEESRTNRNQPTRDEDGSGKERFQTAALINKHRSDTGVYASEVLRYAFYRYSTDHSIDNHVDIIASEHLKKKLKNPHHPVCQAMPNHNIIIAGRKHDDTVSTTTALNSSIMQDLIDKPIGKV